MIDFLKQHFVIFWAVILALFFSFQVCLSFSQRGSERYNIYHHPKDVFLSILFTILSWGLFVFSAILIWKVIASNVLLRIVAILAVYMTGRIIFRMIFSPYLPKRGPKWKMINTFRGSGVSLLIRGYIYFRSMKNERMLQKTNLDKLDSCFFSHGVFYMVILFRIRG